MLLCLPVQAAGAPRAVLNAKDGVVRIFCEVDGDVVSGSGFLVTNTNSGAVVVTNYHAGAGPADWQRSRLLSGSDTGLPRTRRSFGPPADRRLSCRTAAAGPAG